MEEPRLDAEAAIEPNRGLGGLALRSRLVEIESLIMNESFPRAGLFKLVSPFEAIYSLAEGTIEVAVDVRNGKIFKLTARKGYKGRLFDGLYVGMTVREAMKREPKLYYDEAEEQIYCRGFEGLAIDIPEVDPPPELVPDMVIESISVYAKEIETLSGQEGQW